MNGECSSHLRKRSFTNLDMNNSMRGSVVSLRGGGGGGKKSKNLGAQFKNELASLVKTIESTGSFYSVLETRT